MNYSYIRPAGKEEIISILSEWQIATKLKRPVLDCLGNEHDYYLVVVRGYKLLVSIKLTDRKGTLEVHIACPRASIKASRVLAAVTMKWLLTDKKIKAKKLLVFAPKGKMSNFAKKLGFTETLAVKCQTNELALEFKL